MHNERKNTERVSIHPIEIKWESSLIQSYAKVACPLMPALVHETWQWVHETFKTAVLYSAQTLVH